MSNVDINVDRRTDGLTDGRKIGRLYRTLLQAGAIKMIELFANSGDPDQTPRSAASDQGLHFLLITPLGVSRLQWVNRLMDKWTDRHKNR